MVTSTSTTTTASGSTRAGSDLSLLFAPPVRWGYEFVAPAAPAHSPERAHPPQQRAPRMVPRAQAAGLRQAAVLAAVGALGILVLDSKLGVFTLGGAKGAAAVLVFVVNLAAAGVAFRAALAWQRSSGHGTPTGATEVSGARRYAIPVANAVVTFLVPWLVLPVEAVVAGVRIIAGKQDLVVDPGDRAKAEAEYLASVEAWQERIRQFEEAERRRYETVDLWYPVVPSSTASMVCVFGGTHISWAAALATLGSTMLGSGSHILVGDLSRRRTTDPLLDLCRVSGVPAGNVVLPAGADQAELFSGLDWNELSTILVEVLHSANQDLDSSRRERQEDRAVIRDVAECLDPEGPVSIRRLRQSMLVVEGADVRPGESSVTADEYDRLAALYNAVQRQHGGVMERVTRIERALRDFELLDGAQAGSTAGVPTATGRSGRGSSLAVVEIDKRAHDLDNDRLVDLLYQLLLRRVRTRTSQADALFILGADRIRRDALESLVTYAREDHVGVVLFFEHLRQDAVEVVGAGGAAAAFFVLGNHREAKEASEFIGSEYKWVESQHTRSESESLTKTWGEEWSWGQSQTRGFPTGYSLGESRTEGRSYGEAFGNSREYSVSDQRVREALIEPEVLMGLPVTGMIYMETRGGGERVVKNVDCHPQIRFVPRVSPGPATTRS